MRKILVVALATLFTNALIDAERLPNGLEFQMPNGWSVKANDAVAVLLPPDWVTEPGGKNPSELYLLDIEPGIKNPQDPQLASILLGKYFTGTQLRRAGFPQPFQAMGGSGYVCRYDAVSQGVALRVHIYVVGLTGGGVAGLIAIARPELLARRETTITAVATTLARAAGTLTSPASTLTSPWDQRLRGHKLYQFSSYSSSYGSGGMNSQKTLRLAADGTYEFHRSGSVSIYASGANGTSASQRGAQGRWRIYEQDGKALLELVSNAGATETITLTSDGTKTLLNGQRWLVGD
ncbi:MAG TPA: hypothetical protein VKU01_30440 [Bryobacteraceae bacterium]|nr:hypothetical protein [Bryobacteraceae bacterium]